MSPRRSRASPAGRRRAATKHEIGFVAVGVGALVGWSMARVRAGWAGLPFVAAVIALVAILVGELVLDAYLLADALDVGFGDVFSSVVSTPSFAADLFKEGFSPIDALFWLIAVRAAYQFVRTAVTQVRAQHEAPAGPHGPQG